MKFLIPLLLLALASPTPAPQGTTQVVVLEPVADATLIESATGALANGQGLYLHAGRTNQPTESLRRGLLRFDVAAALPPQARIEEARLVLHVTGGNGEPVELAVHLATRAWTEGPSNAPGGQGAPAQPGDVTWLHASYPTLAWNRPGGDLLPPASATTTVNAPGAYTLTHPQRLARDVRLWLKSPGRNHGWMLLGDEQTVGGSRRVDSRESADPTLRPRLEIRYRLPGPPP